MISKATVHNTAFFKWWHWSKIAFIYHNFHWSPWALVPDSSTLHVLKDCSEIFWPLDELDVWTFWTLPMTITAARDEAREGRIPIHTAYILIHGKTFEPPSVWELPVTDARKSLPYRQHKILHISLSAYAIGILARQSVNQAFRGLLNTELWNYRLEESHTVCIGMWYCMSGRRMHLMIGGLVPKTPRDHSVKSFSAESTPAMPS